MHRKTLEQRQRQNRLVHFMIIVGILLLFAMIVGLTLKPVAKQCADTNTGMPVACSSLAH